MIRSRSAVESWSGLLYALETVDGDTPTGLGHGLQRDSRILHRLSVSFF